MSLKVHFIYSYTDYFPKNLEAYGEEQDGQFH